MLDVVFVSETWERRDVSLTSLLNLPNHKIISKKRVSANPGGGVAIIINDKYQIEDPKLEPPSGVEVVWSVLKINHGVRIERIALSSLYVPPRSRKTQETLDFIISSIHLLKAEYDDIKFIIGGDRNNMDFNVILQSYRNLRQTVEIPTHSGRILDIVITDIKDRYYPPFVKPPLDCDLDLPGQPSDHNIVFVIPTKQINNASILPPKKVVMFRPLPESGMLEFGRFITAHHWLEVIEKNDVNEKTEAFHRTIRSKFEEIFPEKIVTISPLDKPWMNPSLKKINRQMKREYWKNRRSVKYLSLKNKFSRLKKVQISTYYSKLFDEVRNTNPAKWYSLAKKIGLKNDVNEQITIECLEGLPVNSAADRIAEHFASISQEYDAISPDQLPSFLPAQPPPVLQDYQVYTELKKMKKTKSTLPIDIPYKLRNEFAAELAKPLTNILNACLQTGIYPKKWKFEWVTPVPKTKNPKVIKDLRKISCTSDYSKLFERFLKNWILEDIQADLDPAQFGNQKGTGTEHMLVKMLDKIITHLDNNQTSPAVIATMLDWSAAFDRQCPNIAIQKFSTIGVRASINQILASYLQDRYMMVKFNGTTSSTYHMPGGGPQGTLLGVLEYLVQCNDNAHCVQPDLRFKYVDDLTILELLSLSPCSGNLSSYNCKLHVPSDIGTDQHYIHQSNLLTQNHVNTISEWTRSNKMLLNSAKSNYMIFTRRYGSLCTRLNLDGNILEKVSATKLLGVWISEDLDWELNTSELCKKAYSRISLLCKLKYVGMSTQDLLKTYISFIRCLLEYACVVWHSTLTVNQTCALERVQKTCLRVILGRDYEGYESALEVSNLETLEVRREKLCLSFGKKCLLSSNHRSLFPRNIPLHNHNLREQNLFTVVQARTERLRRSCIHLISKDY